jgi:carboxyl-terminal processing protease
VSDLLTVDPSGGSVNAALGPSTIGLTVFFQVIPVGSTVPELRQATKAVYSLDPVPPQKLLAIPNTTPQRQAGYVMLRTFAGDSTPNELKAAFAAFRDAGVSDVIIDVRYNGGGLLSIAETLADLLGKDLAGQTMYTVSYNARHAVQAPPASFAALAEAPDGPLRVAFIVTGASASASELVPNALEPYRQNDLALIGSSTYGKPIGQINFKIPDCSLDVFLISFQLENKQGDGSYFDGLPDAAGQFSSPTCAADDDLTHPVGDPNEASTAQALSWLANTTTCTPIPPRTGPVASAGALEIAPSLPPPTYASTPDLPGVW